MARIRPFAAWRYASDSLDISALVAPPYDVISPDQRADLLARDAHNAVALELPGGSLDPHAPDNRYVAARTTWDDWRARGVLKRDAHEAIYVLEQTFVLDGRPVSRRAFIVEVGLEPFSAQVVLPHERTLPKALGDRFELIKATQANFSQVFGLFEDPDRAALDLFAAMGEAPVVATATDDAGVRSTLRACTDAVLTARMQQLLADRRIFIADGHHRYTTALANRDAIHASRGASDNEPHDFVMMALVSMSDPDLIVLPTHRVADSIDEFDTAAFCAALADHFELAPVEPSAATAALDAAARPAFLVRCKGDDAVLLAALRADADLEELMPAGMSGAWRNLDVAVLQELVLSPLLGIHPDRPATLDRLTFVKDTAAAFDATREHDVAFILRSTSMQELADVALAGETMPQKSTYFYPKLLTGLLFRSTD